MPSVTRLLDDTAMAGALQRMAREVVEKSGGTGGLVLVGIQRRGVELAARVAALIGAPSQPVPLGKLDITLYRDDLSTIGPRPRVGEASLPDSIDFGRPRRILLCVLVDRGGRELPIQADIVGQRVETQSDDRVDVAVRELDGRDAVELVRGAPL
jgi:pyrimidine operon attenuation protein/uracil phosphoribosyltransferase